MTGVHWSLRARLVTAFGLMFAGFSLVLLLVLPHRLDRQARAAMQGEAQRVAELIAATLVGGLEFDDAAFVREQLANLQRLPDATRAVVYEDGAPVATWARDGALPQSDSLQVTAPVAAPGGTRGEVVVTFSLRRLEAQSLDNRVLGGLMALVTLTVGMIVAWGLGTVFARPLHRLTDRALQVAEGRASLGDFATVGAPGDARSPDEGRRLRHALRLMAERILREVAAAEAERVRATEAEEHALQASAAKSAFLANMSHELRTPLNAIIGFAEILQEDSEDRGEDWMRADLQRITTSGRHLLELISDVLDLSKIEAGFMEITPEDTDLDALIRDVGLAVTALVRRNRNALSVDVPEPLGLRRVDPLRVRQCLINLLGNAAKFTRDGRVTLRVLARDRRGEAWLCMEVEDTGIGMSDEQLELIFRPFTQAEATTTRNYGGSGLGLTLTRRFCELMGGSIEVESAPGVGSTFRMLVPAVAVEAESAA